MTPQVIAHEIAQLALTKKASDVVIMHVAPLTDVTDYFVICTGDSDIQVKAIAEAVSNGMYEHGIRAWRSEGFRNLQWVLLDYVDVVLHVFQKSTREYYNLEKLWGDAEVERIIDEAPGNAQVIGRPTGKEKRNEKPH